MLRFQLLLQQSQRRLEFAFAQQPVVDKKAGLPIADGPVNQSSSDRGIYTAGESANSPARFRRAALLMRSVCSAIAAAGRPIAFAAADFKKESCAGYSCPAWVVCTTSG